MVYGAHEPEYCESRPRYLASSRVIHRGARTARSRARCTPEMVGDPASVDGSAGGLGAARAAGSTRAEQWLRSHRNAGAAAFVLGIGAKHSGVNGSGWNAARGSVFGGESLACQSWECTLHFGCIHIEMHRGI